MLDAAVHDGREWLRVLLPSRPNGSAGWIPRDKAQLSRTRYWVTVRTRSRTVSVYRDGDQGAAGSAPWSARRPPRPRTCSRRCYERNRQPDPRAFLGPWSLPLTAFSDVLQDFGGGPGRVAIHGRAGASLADPLGQRAVARMRPHREPRDPLPRAHAAEQARRSGCVP